MVTAEAVLHSRIARELALVTLLVVGCAAPTSGEVTVEVRAGFVDTAVVPLERVDACLWARRDAGLGEGSS
jgi:hypothetical protein